MSVSYHTTQLEVDSESDSAIKDSFTNTVNIPVFISGTFDLFDVLCQQHNRTVFNPFLNGTKNGDVDGKQTSSISFCFAKVD